MSRTLTHEGTVNDVETEIRSIAQCLNERDARTDTNVAALTAQLAERDATIERLHAQLAQLQEWYSKATTIIVKGGLSL